MEITSAKNETYKYIKSLLTKKDRDREGRYTVEGIKSVSDASEAKADIEFIAVSDKYNGKNFDKYRTVVIADKIFPQLCDTKTPQGIIAVIKKRKCEKKPKDGRYIYCDRIRDPGNLGTIIRTADAAGFEVILSEECADLYSPKTVRASMGSFFRVNVYENVGYEELKSYGIRLLGAALSKESIDYKSADYTLPVVIVVGNEANGISSELLDVCDNKVIIPIYGEAESLNAAVAASILMYEAVRGKSLT